VVQHPERGDGARGAIACRQDGCVGADLRVGRVGELGRGEIYDDRRPSRRQQALEVALAAEEAPDTIATVLGDVDVERWDAPMTYLPDRDAVLRYCRSHSLHRDAADRVTPPVWLTKRGCVVYASKQ